MNLHEECLLKYLLNPLDLFYSTEQLVMNNSLIEKKVPVDRYVRQNVNVNYIRA